MGEPFAIVAGDFTPWGGMDRPNYELAWHLAERRGVIVHLVSHRVASPLAEHPNVVWHRAPRPMGRHRLGSPFLDRLGRRVARWVTSAGGRVVVNGGNCRWHDINWVHYVHAAAPPLPPTAPRLKQVLSALQQRQNSRRELEILTRSRLVIADSDTTRRQLIDRLSLEPERVRTVYYGIDPEQFRPATPAERQEARLFLKIEGDRPVVAFVGALGVDRRKGFDVFFDAWVLCNREPGWDALLIAAGVGGELDHWRRRATEADLGESMRLIGFTSEVGMLLKASDALVSPTRFEPYGQGVHEAICCGLPAFVTRSAGVAERYPTVLLDLLLDHPPDASQLAERLRNWRRDVEGHRPRAAAFSESLRKRTWADMAEEICRALEPEPE